jgi:hypothetical protein
VKVANQVLKSSEVVKAFAYIKHDAYAGREIRERSKGHRGYSFGKDMKLREGRYTYVVVPSSNMTDIARRVFGNFSAHPAKFTSPDNVGG